MHITNELIVLIISAVLSSAGIAALINGGFNFFMQRADRSSRRKELIFKAAIEQAQQRVTRGIEMLKLSGGHANVPDETLLAGEYYNWLEHLYDHGKLPEEAIEAERRSQQQIDEQNERRRENTKCHIERVVAQAEKNPYQAKRLLGNNDLRVDSIKNQTLTSTVASSKILPVGV